LLRERRTRTGVALSFDDFQARCVPGYRAGAPMSQMSSFGAGDFTMSKLHRWCAAAVSGRMLCIDGLEPGLTVTLVSNQEDQ